MLVKAVSPQSLQLCPAMSVDGVTWTPRLQLSEQLTSGYRLGHFPLTPCLTQRQVSGISSFFRRHQGRCVVYGWGEDVFALCTALVQLLLKGCSSPCSLLWEQMCFKGVLLWTAMESCSQHGYGSQGHGPVADERWCVSGLVLAMDDPLADCRFESWSSGGRACWCCLCPSPGLMLVSTLVLPNAGSLSIHLCYTSHLLTKQRSGSLLLK